MHGIKVTPLQQFSGVSPGRGGSARTRNLPCPICIGVDDSNDLSAEMARRLAVPITHRSRANDRDAQRASTLLRNGRYHARSRPAVYRSAATSLRCSTQRFDDFARVDTYFFMILFFNIDVQM